MDLISKVMIVCLSACGGAFVTALGFEIIPNNCYIPWLAFNVWMWVAVPCIMWAAKKEDSRKESL